MTHQPSTPTPGPFTAFEAGIEGSCLRYWTAGREDAPWLAFCHGGALDHRDFRALAQRLLADWRVLLWDLPGHGESQPMPQPFTANGCAAALASVMDAAGAEAAALLGFSFGGVIAQVFAKLHPDRVLGLIAYGCFTPHLLPPLAPPEDVDSIVEATFGGLDWTAIKTDFAARCGLKAATRAAVERAMESVGKAGFLAMAKALLRSGDYDPTFRIKGPWISIAGADDNNGAALWAAMEAYQTAYPDAPYLTVPDAGHSAHLDKPGAFETALFGSLEKFRRQIAGP